jgi:hypothetical protein
MLIMSMNLSIISQLLIMCSEFIMSGEGESRSVLHQLFLKFV